MKYLSKVLIILFVSLTTGLALPSVLHAEGVVMLTATVVERKSTDTINDFNLSEVNPVEYGMTSRISAKTGEIKGASTVDSGAFVKFFDRIIKYLKFW